MKEFHCGRILSYSENRNFFLYFILCLLVIWGSGQLVGEIFSSTNPNFDKDLADELKSQNLGVALFMALIAAPFFETAILVYCLHISKQTSYKKYYRLISVLPICLLHLPGNWELFFIVFLPFYFQAIAYISVRERCSLLHAYLFLVSIHFSCNLISMIINISNF